MNRRDFLGTTFTISATSVALPNLNANCQATELPDDVKSQNYFDEGKSVSHVFLVHYDNATHEPEFYVFSTFEGAKKKVEELMNDEIDENGDLAWQPIDVGDITNLWQWSDEREYLSIWKEEVLP